jgi:hypothetical protein
LPNFSGQIGSKGASVGSFQLGAPGDSPAALPAMPTSARPWVAHLYNNDWSFRASLGPLTNRPVIHQVLNSGLQPVTIELPTLNAAIQPGNLIVVTEQGGDATGSAPAGRALYGGIVEDTPDTISAESGWVHQVAITPFVAELGDTYLNKNYSTATDPAQMVRDAINQTTHLRCDSYSVPSTGVTGIYNFTFAPCLEVVNIARLIAGTNWSWYVDAIGKVWFQPINTNGAAMFTVKGGVDYSSRASSGSISGLKNHVLVTGGMPLGASAPAIATYDNPTSQTSYGLRAMNPPINLPTCTDTATLQSVANTVGGLFDRVIRRVTMMLPAFPFRIELGRPGGATMRYFEPSKYPLVESETGSGGYSSTYVVLEVQTDGIMQTVTIGDVPVASVNDLQYEIERITSRVGMANIAQTPFVGQNVTTTPTPAGQPAGSGITLDGSIPAISINDGTRVRIQHGNLSNYTDPNGHTSAAGYGGRVLDSSGNMLWDAIGLIGVMQSGGFAANNSSQALAGSGASNWTDVTGTSFTLTLVRPVRIIYFFSGSAHTSAGTGTGYMRGNIVGFDTTSSLYFGSSGATTSTRWYVSLPGGTFVTIPAGTYTVKMQMAADSGTTLTLNDYFHQVFILGA